MGRKPETGQVSQESMARLQHRATWGNFSAISGFPAVLYWLGPPAPTLLSAPAPKGTAAPLTVSATLRLAGKGENSVYLRTRR